MEKNAIIHVENTENLLEFASYLSHSGWNILSADKTEDFLLSERIPVIHEPGLTPSSLYVNETSQIIRRILFSKYPDENDENYESDGDNNIFIVCMNMNPKILDNNVITENEKIKKIESFHLSSILRNSFSNYQNVLLLTDPSDYKEAIIQLRTNKISSEFREYLAGKVLNLISAYDSGIAASICMNNKYSSDFMNFYLKPYEKFLDLSSGSNAHQRGCIYKSPAISGALNGIQKSQDNVFSYNMISDISFGWERICVLYEILKNQYTVETTNSDGYNFTTQFTPLTGTVFTIAIKFNSIVGAALSTNVLDSFKKTYTYDVSHIDGVVLACSAVVDEISAVEMVKGNFVAIVAPSFTDEAKNILAQNPKIQLVTSAKVESSEMDGKLINGGILIQQKDNTLFSHWNIMTKNRPSQFKADQMAFGMLLAMGARSYSAILLKDNAIVGISQNSTSTERALQIVLADAKMRCGNNNPDNCIGDVLVCDSVINFSEPVKNLIDNGITAIIQTGSSSADNDFINYCDERGIIMVYTGMTHISF